MFPDLTHEQKIILSGLVFLILCGLGMSLYRHLIPQNIILPASPALNSPSLPLSGGILVHIAGAVKKEGVYALQAGDRLVDLIKLAGGATNKADLAVLNLAEKLKDGQRVVVAERIIANPINILTDSLHQGTPVISNGRQNKKTALSVGHKINLNAADQNMLCNINGVGPVLAGRIIDYRTVHGAFNSLEDLRKVKGIGEKKFMQIKEQIDM